MDANASGRTERDWLAFDHLDYLAAKIILSIAVIGSTLLGLGGPVVAAATNTPVPVSYTTKVSSGIQLPRGATHDANADGETTVQLLLTDATPGERFGQALPGLLVAAMTIAVAWMLFQLLRSTQAGEPFNRRNVRRISLTALIIGVGGTLAQVAEGFANSAIYTTGRLPDQAGRSFEMLIKSLNEVVNAPGAPLPIVCMLVLGLVGEVVRRGVELRDDVEGLV